MAVKDYKDILVYGVDASGEKIKLLSQDVVDGFKRGKMGKYNRVLAVVGVKRRQSFESYQMQIAKALSANRGIIGPLVDVPVDTYCESLLEKEPVTFDAVKTKFESAVSGKFESVEILEL